ncbi:MAG: DUF2231 domain-containing protein [Actinomycetota bacterium]|nr:DUF2231 domain-containing protein [Actinomycetota bacterium]
MSRWFSWGPALSYKGRKFKGLRGWSGKPSHPPLTDIPITCYILAAVFDTISVVKGGEPAGRDFFLAATYVLVPGYLVGVLAVLTGVWDWLKSTPKHSQVWRTANAHWILMGATQGIFLVNLIVRWVRWDELDHTSPTLLVLSLIGAGLVTLGSFYGGTLVFDYGFNVENATDLPQYHPSDKDIYPRDKDGGSTG